MDVVEYPAVPAGALRVLGASMSDVPDGTRARALAMTPELFVLRSDDALVVSRRDGSRAIAKLGRDNLATVDLDGTVLVGEVVGDEVWLTRWDGAGEPYAFGEALGRFFELAADDDGLHIALCGGADVAVCDAFDAREVWRRTIDDDLDLPVRAVVLEPDAAAVVLYYSKVDPYDPSETFVRQRIPRTGEVEIERDILRGGRPEWYAPPERALEHTLVRASHRGPLAVSRDGTRVASPTFARTVADDTYIRVAALEEWYGSSSFSSSGTAEPVALAYDGDGELVRVSWVNRVLSVETCHATGPARYLHAPIERAVPLPWTRRLVTASVSEAKLDDLVLLSGPVRALACADDGSAIGVALADRVELFDPAGASLGSLPLLAATGLAIARGGRAIACVDRGELAIVSTSGAALGPDDADARVAAVFSPDGTRVAYATTAGFAIVDAASGAVRASHGGLASRVVALAFAPDQATLFTLGADGRITLWSA